MSNFKLTAAEARVAALLVDGATVNEAAAHLRRSKETLRTQLRAIFAKTNTRRQAELIALVLRKLPHGDH